MKRLVLLFCLMILLLPGCGNLSPKINPKQDNNIDNQNGKIDELENLQNSMKNEILSMKQHISDSQLTDVQTGAVNVQGIHILEGPGGLILILSCFTISIIIWYYRSESIRLEKITNILSETIKNYNDDELKNDVFKACMFTDVEKDIYKKIK